MPATGAVPDPPEDDSPGYKWKVAAMLGVIALLNYADRSAVSAVLPLLRHDFDMSNVALAATGSFFLWSYALASPLCGVLADRFARTRVVVVSLVAWSVATALTAFARNTTELLIARVLLGASEAAYLPAAFALLSGHHPSRTRATAMGIHLAGMDLGPVAGGTLAGFVGAEFGWRASFLLLGFLGIAVAVVAQLVLRDARAPADGGARRAAPPSVSALQSLGILLRMPAYLCMLVSMMVVSIGTWIFYNWLPLYFSETFGMSLALAGFSGTATLQVAALVGVLLNGWLSDYLCRDRVERRLLLDGFGYLAAAPFLLVFLGDPTVARIATGCFLFALLRSIGSVNQITIVCELLPDHLRARGIALINVGNCMAGGLGIMAAGYLKNTFGLGGVFAGVSVVMLVAGSAPLVAYRYFRPSTPPAAPAPGGA
ncbi:MAG: MFS transporter [Opitutaceae bacterium]|nr:MFS transporter [Opitutaceae bacterium]